MSSRKVVGYVVRIKSADRLLKEYRDSTCQFPSGQVRRVFATRAEAKIVADACPHDGSEYGWGRVVCRVVRKVKVKPGTVGYVVGWKNPDGSAARFDGRIIRHPSHSPVYKTREEAERVRQEDWGSHIQRTSAGVIYGRAVFAVVCRPKVKPGTVGYRVESTRVTGWYLHGTSGPVQYLSGRGVLYPSRCAAEFARSRHLLGTSGGRILAVIRKGRPVDPTIKGWIIRKRRPVVFASKAEAMRTAAKFSEPCKVVPVREGHAALGPARP